MTEDGRPEVFISYSYDSKDYEEWILSFANRLIGDGIPTTLDKYDLHLGDDTPLFMEKSISNSDYVFIMVTDNYIEKANNRKGGVGYETNLVTGEIVLNGNTGKFIPIFVKTNFDKAPNYLKGKFGIHIDNYFSYDKPYEDLYRKITNQELQKPELGELKIFDDKEKKIFDIEKIKKIKNLDYWYNFDCILKINGLDDFSTPQLYREILKNRISFNQYTQNIKYVPFILNDVFKKSHDNGIVFERGDFGAVINRTSFEKLFLKNKIIRYSIIEMYNDKRFIMVRLLSILFNLLHIFFILQKIETQNSTNISIDTEFGFDTNHVAEYAVNLRFMIKGDSFESYILNDKEQHCFKLNSLDKKSIISFFNRILECFIDENSQATDPYLSIEEEKFDFDCQFLKEGNYYFES